MNEYVAECAIDSSDRITASRSTGSRRIELVPSAKVEVYLDPEDARTFARGILALADEIDGGEPEAEETPKPRPTVGDRVRVVKDDPHLRAGEYTGMVGTLKSVSDAYGVELPYLVEFGDGSGSHGDKGNGKWNVAEVELVDEPTPLADWERDLLAETPASSARGKHIEEAKALLEGVHFDAASLVLVAQFLADGE
ncbi:hypothetical protein [Streptomyces umbrinus]|uniref:hypothetical protein n=1 Tax=Streptomyces umbrinus TaxID=67370 RepID=UPI003426472C